VPRLERAIRAGFVVVATDGEGLGTSGASRYLIGESEAHTILDAARAAHGLPGLVTDGRVALWGYSSGGHGALAAAQAASDYAPDVEVIGTAAVSPVVDVTRFISPVDDHPGYTFITVGAWAKVHHIDPASIFTRRAMARYSRLNTECALTLAFDWPLWRRQDLLRSDLRTTQPWRDLMADELAGTASFDGPVLLIHGASDSIVAPGPTVALARRLCRFGDTVDYRSIPGEDHFIAYTTGAEVIDWLADRAAGRPARSTCA
jgi:alpha-beta hydrolase superfamily lysophospholipase